jgi:hypothetical protein
MILAYIKSPAGQISVFANLASRWRLQKRYAYSISLPSSRRTNKGANFGEISLTSPVPAPSLGFRRRIWFGGVQGGLMG